MGHWATVFRGCVGMLLAAVVVSAPERLWGEGINRSASSETLVEMAYAAEISGQHSLRDALVHRVLSEDPDHERARWLAGEVQSDRGWVPAESAEKSWSGDKLLQEYVQRRDACGEDAASRLKLANWCRSRDMPDREAVHLTELVVWHGANPAVMGRLGMVKFQGQWIPEENVDEFRRMDDRQRRIERKWKPSFAAWKKDLDTDGSAAFERLAERLQGVTDGEALPILEEVLSTHSEQAGLVAVAHLGGLPIVEATESLTRHAVFSQFDAVRLEATKALRKRPKYTYIPMLLAGLVAPQEITIELPYGNTHYVRRTVTRRGLHADEKAVDHLTLYVRGRPFSQTPRLPAALRPGHYVAESAPETKQHNERVQEILYSVSGEAFERPEEYWDWWNRYIENESDEEKPTIEQHRYGRMWAPPTMPSSSCLAWGTPIATETGSRPIEQIMPGDKVLSQNADTGQLEYKVVLRRTVQQLESMREISFGGDSLTVTPGHQFWVAGEGWRMAKELNVGQRLHCLDGSKEITAIEERAEAAAYNLVVDDFATYFAGEGRVFLHDYTYPEPTGAVMPGYTPDLSSR